MNNENPINNPEENKTEIEKKADLIKSVIEDLYTGKVTDEEAEKIEGIWFDKNDLISIKNLLTSRGINTDGIEMEVSKGSSDYPDYPNAREGHAYTGIKITLTSNGEHLDEIYFEDPNSEIHY